MFAPAHLHQPARAFDCGENHHAEEDGRDHAGEKHPAPAGRDVPGFVAHALNQHVDEDSGENSDDDAELIKRYAAAAHARGRNFGDVVRRNHRSRANADSADQPPEDKLVEIRGEKNSNRREREAKRTEREAFFLAEIIGNSSRGGAADDAADQGAGGGPADSCGIEMKQLAQDSRWRR